MQWLLCSLVRDAEEQGEAEERAQRQPPEPREGHESGQDTARLELLAPGEVAPDLLWKRREWERCQASSQSASIQWTLRRKDVTYAGSCCACDPEYPEDGQSYDLA